MDLQVRKQPGPALDHRVLGYSHRDQARIYHFQQVFVPQVPIGRCQPDRRQPSLLETLAKPCQSLVWQRVGVIVNFLARQILQLRELGPARPADDDGLGFFVKWLRKLHDGLSALANSHQARYQVALSFGQHRNERLSGRRNKHDSNGSVAGVQLLVEEYFEFTRKIVYGALHLAAIKMEAKFAGRHQNPQISALPNPIQIPVPLLCQQPAFQATSHYRRRVFSR